MFIRVMIPRACRTYRRVPIAKHKSGIIAVARETGQSVSASFALHNIAIRDGHFVMPRQDAWLALAAPLGCGKSRYAKATKFIAA